MLYFLRNFLGFLIQLLPCMILCFLPFTGKSSKLSRKSIFIGCVVYATITALIFPILNKISLKNTAIIPNFYMLGVVIVFAVVFFLVIREEAVKKFTVAFLVLFYASMQFFLVNLLGTLFPEKMVSDTYSLVYLILYFVSALIFLPILAIILKKLVTDYFVEMEIESIKREFKILLIISILHFAILVFYGTYQAVNAEVFWKLIALPLGFLTVIIFIFYWALFRESLKNKRDRDLQKSMEIQLYRYEKITQDMEKTRRIRHDMKHYFVGLSRLLENNETEKIREYVSEILDDLDKRETKTYCNNQIINGLLQYYVEKAQDENVKCEIYAQCDEIFISAVDLTSIFGNVFENAIRACLGLENCFINAQIGVIGHSLVIQIVNSCKHIHIIERYDLTEEFLPASAFISERKNGGNGLKSIEYVAKKYGGEAYFKFDEFKQTFTTRIRLELNNQAC